MPRKIKNVTKDYLVNVPLPNHADTYTVISYQSVIDYAYAELAAQGFSIVDEEYRCTFDGQIAQGIYKLQYNTDPEMCIMFTWTNSYNKQIKFKCAIGGYVNANGTVMLLGEIGTYVRKHSGTADADTIASMKSQIANADMYYTQLLQDKDKMKEINLSSKRQAELLGILFAEYEILNTEQASIVKQQMTKPSFFYNGGNDTMWAFYNHITYSLQQSHPRSWMEDQRMLHWVITNEVEFTTPVQVIEEVVEVADPLYQIPNQTNILDQIAAVTEIHEFSMAQLAGVKAPEAVDLDTEEDEVWEELEAAGMITPCVAHDAETEKEEVIELTEELVTETIAPMFEERVDETITYTDPVGNTFEALVIPSLEPTVEEVELFEREQEEDFLGFDLDFNLDDDDNIETNNLYL
jgi:hypothetical protein